MGTNSISPVRCIWTVPMKKTPDILWQEPRVAFENQWGLLWAAQEAAGTDGWEEAKNPHCSPPSSSQEYISTCAIKVGLLQSKSSSKEAAGEPRIPAVCPRGLALLGTPSFTMPDSAPLLVSVRKLI